jgi:predicted MFS family arabinose efflux permease
MVGGPVGAGMRVAPAPERGRGTATPVAALGVGAFATGTDLFVVAGVLPGLAADLGITVGTAGLTVTVSAAAYAVGGPLLGAALGAQSRRRVLIGSLALFGACTATAAAAPTFAVLLAARALGALAASVHVPVAAAAAVAAVPARSRGRALGVVLGGASAATVSLALNVRRPMSGSGWGRCSAVWSWTPPAPARWRCWASLSAAPD